MSKKIRNLVLILAGLVLAFLFYFVLNFSFSESKNLKSIYLIPQDAVYLVTTKKPIKNWKEIKKSAIWQHLRTNTYFSELTKSANTLDTILQENKTVFDLLGSKELVVSAHTIAKNKYDFLFVVDLNKTAKLIQFKAILKKLFNDTYSITERTHNTIEIIEFYNKKTRETLYISIINNNLLASYTHTLVEASIDQYNQPTIGRDLKYLEISQNVKDDKIIRLFVQYKYAEKFAGIYTNSNLDWLKDLSKTLIYSGFDIDLIGGEKIIADGFTNTNENSFSYLKALQNSGVGKHEITKVAPQKTAIYSSFGFENYSLFYKNYQQLQDENPTVFKEAKENTKRIEKLLDISIADNFISWIDDEIALLKLKQNNLGKNNDYALVLKSKNNASATKNLNLILRQIKKKTPVKFKEINYKGYPIKFMSIKGFFKTFFGGYFKNIETPYYTIIDEFVVFSNHPNTLKYIITNYTEKNTLHHSVNYTDFAVNFDTKSNFFTYINVPLLYEDILSNVSTDTKNDLQKNKAYFTSFSQIGIQLSPKNNLFKSRFVIQYKDQESLKFSNEFTPDLIGPKQDTKDETEVSKPIIISDIDENNIVLPEINPTDLNAKDFTKKHANGKTYFKVELKDGKKHGDYKEYYKNGELRIKGYFKNNKRAKTWRKYDTKGKVVLKVKY